MKIHVFEKDRLREATWAKLRPTSVATKISKGRPNESQDETKEEKKREVKRREVESRKKNGSEKVTGSYWSAGGRKGRRRVTQELPRTI